MQSTCIYRSPKPGMGIKVWQWGNQRPVVFIGGKRTEYLSLDIDDNANRTSITIGLTELEDLVEVQAHAEARDA